MQDSKKNRLLICWLEEKQNENLVKLLPKFFKDHLNVNCLPADIDYWFRLGKNSDVMDKPRIIVVNFISNIKRSEVFTAKKVLNNTSCAIFEDLTRSRYELLFAAKSKHEKNKEWSAAGKIYCLRDADNGKKM